MIEIDETIDDFKVDLEREEFNEIISEFSKPLLEAFSDKSDQIREKSIRIVREIVSRVEDIEPHLKYIFSVLISRTNCHDLEGIEGVPEVMQPSPGQKPKLMTQLIEPNEVARRLLLNLAFTLVEVIEEDEMRLYINEMVNIVRVFLMDPFGEI